MISAPDNDVVINIYELQPDPNREQKSISRILGGLLRSAGMGTYHTSVSIRNQCYSFAAVAGITKTSRIHEYVPQGASFQESINLGPCTLETQGEINEVINNLRQFFHGTSYHLANRNCNHFTETFATALLMGDDLINENDPQSLKKYPKWVNRLAKTGTSLGLDHGDVCNVWLEARTATGAHKKISHSLSSSNTSSSLSKSNKQLTKSKSYMKKKELTEKQKAALAKLKK